MCLNSVLEFIFVAMKRDSQLANLLVKTTKLIPAVFQILKVTLGISYERALQSIMISTNDKCTKVLHLALLHPRDHTLTLLHEFIETSENGHFGWQWILKMFAIADSQPSAYFYGNVDVKLALCRFVTEYLLRVSQANLRTNLDQMIGSFDASLYMQSIESVDQQDMTTYGG